MRLLALSLAAFLLVACDAQRPKELSCSDTPDELLGTWTQTGSSSFYTFRSDGSFESNIGREPFDRVGQWCATDRSIEILRVENGDFSADETSYFVAGDRLYFRAHLPDEDVAPNSFVGTWRSFHIRSNGWNTNLVQDDWGDVEINDMTWTFAEDGTYRAVEGWSDSGYGSSDSWLASAGTYEFIPPDAIEIRDEQDLDNPLAGNAIAFPGKAFGGTRFDRAQAKLR